MTELCRYPIINTELKNDLIIVVFCGNLTDVRKGRRTHEEIKTSWNIGSSCINRRCDFNSAYKYHTAYKVEKKLCETPLPEKTELIESISRAGKLTGNGNGMQYFGAILIRSDLSLEELDAYYSRYRSNEWECLVKIQEGQSIEGIDHGTLQFAEEIKDRGYYIVYSWGSENSLLDELDIRGH